MKSIKFKVGDKVRVIANKHCHGFQIGEILTIAEITDMVYKFYKEGSRYGMMETEFEPYEPLTFDHSLALQGSPVYLDGIRISPNWNPCSTTWNYDRSYWRIDGTTGQPFTSSITTIPPVEYVDESRWVWVCTDLAFKSKEEAGKWLDQTNVQLCEVKIKLKK